MRIAICEPWNDLRATSAIVPKQLFILIIQDFVVELVVRYMRIKPLKLIWRFSDVR